jgi:Gas vesicle synthesis protein GvpL/GvpF
MQCRLASRGRFLRAGRRPAKIGPLARKMALPLRNPEPAIAPGKALYLYGVSRLSSARSASGKSVRGTPVSLQSAGVDGIHPVRPLICDRFICWVSEVDAAAFADALGRNLENLDWLALHSVRHQEVVGEIAAATAVVPARFGTVFSGEAALLRNIQERKTALAKVFKKITAADEWGVKVFAERQPAPAAMAEVKSGSDYLRQKAARLKKRPERNDAELQQLATQLARVARASAHTGKVSGGQPDLLWQATFLLPRARRKQWDQVLKKFVQRWEGTRRIEVNGPWPPYSFVSDAE